MSADVGLALRAPWYVRERHDGPDLRDGRSLRPVIQKYDGPDFVTRVLADPRDSLVFTDDDHWSYPVPVTPSLTAKGRDRLATSQLVRSKLRKLYQPAHDRFYLVVVEVFCDAPGLPRAGLHTNLEMTMVMRRQHVSLSASKGPLRRLARNLLREMMKEQHPAAVAGAPDADVRELWWVDSAARRRFEEENADLLSAVTVHTDDQTWVRDKTGPGRWCTLGDAEPGEHEEELPMWRIPASTAECDAARSRSLWFGLVPTYSAEHWVQGGVTLPKLDERGTYEIQCIARYPLVPGHEHCPQSEYVSAPTEPFRLADPFDPDGTKNRTVSITLPDLRRLAARAGQKQGPGGVRITTPPRSQLSFNPFDGIPGSGRIGPGGGVCTFALELFFIVAFFLFMLFLPIVVLAFQLWWLLALRFCIPPSIGFTALADFFAKGGLVADLDAELKVELDAALGTDTSFFEPGSPNRGVWAAKLDGAVDPASGDPVFANDPNLANALVVSTDPSDAVEPSTPEVEEKPEDPLCLP